MRVMILVTHLLGTGHLVRALHLGRAFAAGGHEAHLVSGGLPAPHLDTSSVSFHQLPPVCSDGVNFTRLLDEGRHEASKGYMDRRHKLLCSLATDIAPDLVITELFPFGRRVLRDEFQAFLGAVDRRKTKIAASIRDILAPPSKPAKADFADDMLERFYDAVLVHGDRDIATLDLSWPVTKAVAQRLHYTGFIAPDPPPLADKRFGIVVSVGGGSVGQRVFEAVNDAARDLAGKSFTFFTKSPAEVRQALSLAPNVEVTPLSPEFRARLAASEASVSLVGYNTALDILQSGTPAVLVPFDDGGEVEQSLRAGALKALPAVQICRSDALTADAMSRGLAHVLGEGPRPRQSANMDGALQTVRICADLLERH